MTTKFISLITGLVSLVVYLQSLLSSNDPLFSLISNNIIVSLVMLLLATATIAVSFRTRFNSWYSYAACVGAAVVLCIAGMSGFIFPAFTYSLWGILLPLNYMMMLECGIILGLSALTYRHAERPAKLDLPVLPVLSEKFKPVLSVPKISHPPSSSSQTRRTQPA